MTESEGRCGGGANVDVDVAFCSTLANFGASDQALKRDYSRWTM